MIVEADRPRPRVRTIVDDLAAAGRYHFTAEEMRSALGVSGTASKLALGRLIKQRKVASPARGFYVIVPPEYRSLGCLPADQFIPALMEYRKLRYYAALLSAAQYHGAARPTVSRRFLTPAGRRSASKRSNTSNTSAFATRIVRRAPAAGAWFVIEPLVLLLFREMMDGVAEGMWFAFVEQLPRDKTCVLLVRNVRTGGQRPSRC